MFPLHAQHGFGDGDKVLAGDGSLWPCACQPWTQSLLGVRTLVTATASHSRGLIKVA